MQYKINDNDRDLINRLFKIILIIDNIYSEMFKLELNGNRNSEEYEKLLKKLDTVVKEGEDNIYRNIMSSKERCFAIIRYIKNNPIETNEDLPASFKLRSKKRVIEFLEKYGDLNDSCNFCMIHEEQKELVEISEAFELEMQNNIISIIDDYMKNDGYKKYIGYLLKAKYNILFTFKNIEHDFLNNNFESSNILSISSNVVVASFSKEGFYQEFSNKYGANGAIHQIEEMLSITDTECSNIAVMFELILRQIHLRAALLFVDEETISSINKYFCCTIESEEYKHIHESDIMSKYLIMEAFTKIVKDKEIYMGEIFEGEITK